MPSDGTRRRLSPPSTLFLSESVGGHDGVLRGTVSVMSDNVKVLERCCDGLEDGKHSLAASH